MAYIIIMLLRQEEKTKLIIIDTHNYKSIWFKRNLERILAESKLKISDILTIR